MSPRRKYTELADEWLTEYYGKGTPTAALLPEFEALFGWRPTEQALTQHCFKIGLHKEVFYAREAPGKAKRVVKWKDEPEMQAWMEEHDNGQLTVGQVSRAFAEEFGFPLSRTQVGYWRMMNGRTVRRQPKPAKYAVGDEIVRSRPSGKHHCSGYVMVKVADAPKRPGTKDNWKLKHVMVWEETHGQKVPPDTCIVFADHDNRNFDPDNLVAVPQRLMAKLNSSDAPEWSDPESLRAAIALCELGGAVFRAERRLPRACPVCGRVFQMPENSPTNNQTCPECLEQGHKAKGNRKPSSGPLTGTCAVCGREFAKRSKSQVRCEDCIRAKPKHWAVRQRETRERAMKR